MNTTNFSNIFQYKYNRSFQYQNPSSLVICNVWIHLQKFRKTYQFTIFTKKGECEKV